MALYLRTNLRKDSYVYSLFSRPHYRIEFRFGVSWREDIILLLDDEIVGLSPMRGNHYLEESKSIEKAYEEIVLSSARGIMTRGYNDCKRCDVVIVNLLGSEKVSIGTVMEIAWARSFHARVALSR